MKTTDFAHRESGRAEIVLLKFTKKEVKNELGFESGRKVKTKKNVSKPIDIEREKRERTWERERNEEDE